MATSQEIAQNMAEKLAIVMRSMGISFILKGKPLPYSEAFSEQGMLPAIARRADQLCSLCMGYGIGVTFEDAANTVTGSRVTFDTIAPDVLRYLCIVDVLAELAKAATDAHATALDELLDD
jgi:intracellular multiplication protein IcmS